MKGNFARKTTLFMLICLLLLLTVSCTKNVINPESSSSDACSSETSSREQPKNDPEIMKKYDVNGDGKIMLFFIGNSYTLSFDIPTKVKRIAKTQGIYIGEYVRAESGYRLSVAVNEVINYHEFLKNSDIVILQDAGYSNQTYELIPQIKALFDKKVLFYYYPFLTSLVKNKDYLRDDITYVPTGDIFREITKKYDGDYFIDNEHNNELCSYIFANAIYCVIFNADCTNYPYKTVTTTAFVPGETTEERENTLLECRKIVMQVINNQTEALYEN